METQFFNLHDRVMLLDPYKFKAVGKGTVTAKIYDCPYRYNVTLDGNQQPEQYITANCMRAVDE